MKVVRETRANLRVLEEIVEGRTFRCHDTQIAPILRAWRRYRGRDRRCASPGHPESLCELPGRRGIDSTRGGSARRPRGAGVGAGAVIRPRTCRSSTRCGGSDERLRLPGPDHSGRTTPTGHQRCPCKLVSDTATTPGGAGSVPFARPRCGVRSVGEKVEPVDDDGGRTRRQTAAITVPVAGDRPLPVRTMTVPSSAGSPGGSGSRADSPTRASDTSTTNSTPMTSETVATTPSAPQIDGHVFPPLRPRCQPAARAPAGR